MPMNFQSGFHIESLQSDSTWEGESALSTTTESLAVVDTVIHDGRIPAFPLSDTKSAVFHKFSVFGPIPDDEQLARTSSPYTLYTFKDLQLRVSGLLEGDTFIGSVTPRMLPGNPLAGAEKGCHCYAEPLHAATVAIGGSDFPMLVLLDVLRGHRPALAVALGVVHPLFTPKWKTFDVMASTARGFFHGGQLIVVHADLLPISRPWKHLPAGM